jgi:hypothetical protein
MTRIIYVPRVKLEGFLRRNSKGRYFGIMFRKQDGSLRTLNARLGIRPSGNGRKTIGKDSDPYLVVYSNNDQGYRAVNLNTVLRVTMNGNSYLPSR